MSQLRRIITANEGAQARREPEVPRRRPQDQGALCQYMQRENVTKVEH